MKRRRPTSGVPRRDTGFGGALTDLLDRHAILLITVTLILVTAVVYSKTLYGDFITEASHLIADAFDHSLDQPKTLVKLYAILGRPPRETAVHGANRRSPETIFDLIADMTNYGRWLPGSEALGGTTEVLHAITVCLG